MSLLVQTTAAGTAPPPLPFPPPLVVTARGLVSDGTAPPAGFWLRACAHLIDSTLFSMIITPILIAFLMGDLMEISAQAQQTSALVDPLQVIATLHSPAGLLIQYGLPAVAVVLLWRWRSATPGKMILGLKIVDAKTRSKPGTVRLLVRFFGYLVSMIPLGLGFFWVAWDGRKQGWHDKLARTLVVSTKF